MWLTHPGFLNIVRNIWQIPIYGTKQLSLCIKLKALKPPLKTLNRHEFSHISERAKRAQDDFLEAHNMLLNDPSSSSLKAKVQECRKGTNFLLEAERQFLQQKLKNKHLLFADRGPNIFTL